MGALSKVLENGFCGNKSDASKLYVEFLWSLILIFYQAVLNDIYGSFGGSFLIED